MAISGRTLLLLLHLTALISSGSTVAAMKYSVINDAKQYPGGVRFEKEIGVPYTIQTMPKITAFIYNMLQQHNPADRRPIDSVIMKIQQYDGAEAITYGNIVNVSALYLQIYQGNLKWEFTSLMHHEITHVFQWLTGPPGLIEGIADYTILKANYYPPGFAKRGAGDRWNQGYDITARFLEYCDGLKPGFVAALNKKMKDGYNDEYFVQLLKKPVGQLWKEYKAKYGKGGGVQVGSN